jgi:hypothetical protein
MIRTIFASCLLALSAAAVAMPVAAAPAQDPARKPDLADYAAGTWEGDVTSDMRGSSQSDVVVTVTRVGKNLVEVSSDYDRLPTVRVPLTNAAGSIVHARGDTTFLIERNRDANRLDLYIDGAALIVRR